MSFKVDKRVGSVAEIDAAADFVESVYFVVRDRADMEICKNLAAGSRDPAEVFVFVDRRLNLFNVFRLGDKLFPDPAFRHIEICAAVDKGIGTYKLFLNVDPALNTSGRIKGIEYVKFFTAAHKRLIDCADFLGTVEFVKLLVPDVSDVTL